MNKARLRLRSVLVLVVAVLLGATACGSRELLSNVSFAPDTISPNADGVADVTNIHYELSRNATVSIYFESGEGQRYFFREAQPRSAGAYDVLFSGVIAGRLLADGAYRWVIEAIEEGGQRRAAEGQLALAGGESTAPEIANFSISPPTFTPNRDGISDRATINVYLNKPATLHVTLQNAACDGSITPPLDQPKLDCTPFPIAENPSTAEARQIGEAGFHEFDYDAGVDLGADPPPDGAYIVTARAEDAVGQATALSSTLTIVDGGVPRAEIVDAEVQFSSQSALLGQTLYFTLTVENYGAVPIRTSGPPPGYVYDDMEKNYNSAGFATESGVWRVGLGFETMQSDYPFRWAVGQPDDLIVNEIDGVEYYYLPPDTRATITGGVKLTQVQPRNPVNFFAALIHEDVEISQINNRVDPQPVRIDEP
ncbi:MAG TPA: hypothetical protein VJG32_11725 [Anaerolineae bacterium]|nr:hypothetical protein [Anaerolineae bacterium]